MSSRKNSHNTPNAISSPGSGFGPMRCEAPGGATTGQSGQEAAHANLSARQAKEKGMLTSGTYGHLSSGSSDSADLASSLGSRLQIALEKLGSTLYQLTWKEKATPAGRSFSQLVASVRHTCENGYIGWPTPRANDAKKSGDIAIIPRNGIPGIVRLAAWPTPTKRDYVGKTRPLDHPDARPQLPDIANVAGPARLTATGKLLTGSDAGMANGGQLNPTHSRWLMGLPPEWDDCAAMAMQSLPLKPKHSSKP